MRIPAEDLKNALKDPEFAESYRIAHQESIRELQAVGIPLSDTDKAFVEEGIKTVFWQITAWQMNGKAGWTRQPVIIVEGRKPFYADHPSDYITELKLLHNNPEVARGPFWEVIGQLEDGYEQAWNIQPELGVQPCDRH